MPAELELDVNGRREVVRVEPDTALLQVLRNDLGLTAAKLGCGLEQCHACAVLVDGEAATSCATPVEAFVGRRIVTLEGLARRRASCTRCSGRSSRRRRRSAGTASPA